MSDLIELTGLRVRGFHGVFEHERRDGQDFVVDVGLTVDTRAAAAADDLTRTVHYGTLAQSLAAVIAGEPVDLIETLAARLAAVCLADPRVQHARVTVHKPGAPIPLQFTDVAVTIERDQLTEGDQSTARDQPTGHDLPTEGDQSTARDQLTARDQPAPQDEPAGRVR